MGNITWDFKGKVVVITGGATGIGRGTAIEFAKAGADIAVCDFNLNEAENTVKACTEAGAKAKFYKMDVTEVDQINAARDAILADFGKVDVLFSNAGISSKVMGPPVESIPPDDWTKTFEVNTFGMVKVCSAFAPTFREQKSGKIILTSSIAAYLPSPITMPYSGSKIACINFAQALSMDLGPYNVNVNVLCPGFVYTNIYSDGTAFRWREARPEALGKFNEGEAIMNAMASASAMRRAQSVQDMAYTVMFLSAEESKEITGQVFCVDSGFIRR